MANEIETTTVDDATADYFIASAATWGTSPEWQSLMVRASRLDFIELSDPPLRRTPPRPRTWPRGKWFALSRRRRKSPPIVW